MTTDLSKQAQNQLDGFDSFNDEIESDDAEQAPSSSSSSSIIVGTRIKFGNAKTPTTWLLGGEPLSPKLELVAIDILRVEQKWPPEGDNSAPYTRILAPGEKFRDVKKLNAETPEDEWRIGPDGQPKGPYENAHVLYLLDPATMDRFTYLASTLGGMRCVSELVSRVTWMRKFRGVNVYAVVAFADTFMKTQFGGRQRPHLEIKHWIRFGDGGTPLPAPEQPALTSEAVEPQAPKASPQKVESPSRKSGAWKVEEPSLKEQLDDDIPW